MIILYVAIAVSLAAGRPPEQRTDPDGDAYRHNRRGQRQAERKHEEPQGARHQHGCADDGGDEQSGER